MTKIVDTSHVSVRDTEKCVSAKVQACKKHLVIDDLFTLSLEDMITIVAAHKDTASLRLLERYAGCLELQQNNDNAFFTPQQNSPAITPD